MSRRTSTNRAVFKPIKTGLINRDEEDKILNLAMLTNEHMLMIGKPGTAKSLQADLFFEQVEGSFFKASLTKYSGEEVVFGPIDIPALQKSEYRHNIDGSILSSDYAFIDEIFDASDALLRSLLSVLNERMFERGKFKVKCPLKTAVATANYSRMSEITEAVVDRFLFQWAIKPLGRSDLEQLFSWKRPKFRSKISLSAIRDAQKEYKKINIPENLRRVFLDVCTEQGFTARRVHKSMDLVKAAAFMRGGYQVHAEDMMSMRFVVGTEQSYIDQFIKDLEERTIVQERIRIQMEQVELIESEWASISGDETEITHLKREKRVIEKIESIDVVDDGARTKVLRLKSKWQKHYMKHRNEYLDELGLE